MFDYLAKLIGFVDQETNDVQSERLQKESTVPLKFTHCQFLSSDISQVTIERVTVPGKVGYRPLFQVRLKDGSYFQISPDNVIPSNTDRYYRDNNKSYQFLMEIGQILSENAAAWHLSEAAKQYARSQGIPVIRQP